MARGLLSSRIMKTLNRLCGVLVVLLAGCFSEPLEGASGRVGENGEDPAGDGDVTLGDDDEGPSRDRDVAPGDDDRSGADDDRASDVPAIGEPCTEDVCVDEQSLRVCGADGVFVWDIDCTQNQGECGRDGERELCKPVGWDCETRCLDDHTLEICWSDLSQSTITCDDEGFEGYVCDPEGAFDPLTGKSEGVCTPGACDCDSYETDPAAPVCCDAGCDCDVDCGAGEPECGAQVDPEPREDDPVTPDGWDCDAAYYGTGDGCDCECGAPDPDCEGDDSEPYGCQDGEYCDADGHCAS